MKQCEVKGCTNNVFSHKRCKYHYKYVPKKTNKAVISIKTHSNTRMEQFPIYNEIRTQKRLKLISEGKWRCFFSDEKLDNRELEVDWHHLGGRKGNKDGIPLFIYKPWIVPCLHKYHQMWHDEPLSKIKQQSWFNGFVARLKETAEPLYNKLLLKLFK